MQHADIRLDDAARAVVNFFPQAMMELFDPVEEPLRVAWHSWQPSGQDRLPSWSNRTYVRRLDTQLAPARWSPDAGYACTARSTDQIWGWELQSRWRNAPPARAGTCLIQLWRQGDAALSALQVELRLIEVRTQQAPRPLRLLPSARRGTHTSLAAGLPGRQAEPLNLLGLVQFVSTDALLRLDPNDPRFVHPWCWPLVCLSRQVSADQIMFRHRRLMDLEATHATSFIEVRLLLGLVGRARLPDDRRFVSVMEHAMKHAAVKEALNLGFLTDQERNRILLEATAVQTRIYNERLEAAKDQGKLEGKLELARKVLARALSSSALEAAMAHLSGLESAEAIDDALMAMMAGN